MNAGRTLTVVSGDLARLARGPMLWILLGLTGLLAWGLSTGDVLLGTGTATVGGRHAWITSEFSNAFVFSVLASNFYAFFVSILAGLSVLQDQEWKVEELLHTTRLAAREYAWGKALAILSALGVVLALNVALAIVFNHLLPNPDAAEIRGPFELLAYLRPAALFAFPTLVFFGGVTFYLGARLRRPAVAFLFPLATTMLCFSLLWNWAPTWLDPRLDRFLMLLDPSGFRWLNETWLKLDRGAEFYNTASVGLDGIFVANRLLFLGLGILGVILATRHVSIQADRGQAASGRRKRRRPATGTPVPEAASPVRATATSGLHLAMSQAEVAFPTRVVHFARAELRAVLVEPGLYMFWFFVLSQSLATSLLIRGPFQTAILLTPGQHAVAAFDTLSLTVCLLVLFFQVEALERERATGCQPLIDSAPHPTGALVVGKTLAMSALAGLILLASYLAGVVALLIQGQVAPAILPHLLVWGLFLLPTFLFWSCFVSALHALTGSRLVTLGGSMGLIGWLLYRDFTDQLTWVGNWLLWGALRWTDWGIFELDRPALILNRLLVLALAAGGLTLAVRLTRRRALDATQLVHHLSWRWIAPRARRLAPVAVVPALVAIPLWLAVAEGRGGPAAQRANHDYWRQNVSTWEDAPQPALSRVEVDLTLEPTASSFRTRGTFELTNHHAEPLSRFALTGGAHWRELSWTLDGEAFEPEDRSGLYVFSPPDELDPGATLQVGFEMHGRLPDGISENGGELWEFILPSGVVLTSFEPSFVPVVGFDPTRGVGDDNQMDPPDYPDDLYLDSVEPAFSSALAFDLRLTVDTPEEFLANGVGVLESEVVEAGRRTRVWVSDHPVRFFNVVANRWQVHRGHDTEIYHHPDHGYNVEAMSRALDASRRYYSEWFAPYPWRDLRLSEFPAYATYAQGFPTNITFSENIGFLTRPDDNIDVVLLVTGHEAAHQWWGNLLTPGYGPGGNILSEGMAHFSTLLLFEQLEGPAARRELAKRFEESYGNRRRRDAERPLVKTDGTQPGDGAVTYDKGGWVFWMLLEHLGRERMLEGLQTFIDEYANGPDYPLLEDLLATLRPLAEDAEDFDRFARQWFFEVAVPEYRFSEARVEQEGDLWHSRARLQNHGTGSLEVEVAALAESPSEEGESPREARITVHLGPGEARDVEIVSRFEPDRLLVDPDVEVLMLWRQRATVAL